MNRDLYAIALNNALKEINKAYPEIHHSFIFSNESNIIAADTETNQETMNNILEFFETIKENAKAIGNIKSFQLDGKNGKLLLVKIEDMNLVLKTSKNMDNNQIHSITNIIIPTILKTLEAFTPTHLQPASPPQKETQHKELQVDTLTGFFAGDSVQIDTEILTAWNTNDDPRARVRAALTGEKIVQEPVENVKIETFDGNSTYCKVKEIDNKKLKGKNIIRIPEKLCKDLEINKGDLVKVQPM
jgi:predicted regulator of Ras-like GTPase activity (Roadblock/LC7/MglB family)